MRRVSSLAVLAVVGAMTITGCGSSSDTNAADNTPAAPASTGSASGSEAPTPTDSASASAPAADEDVCKDATGDGPLVGLAYDVGGRGDQSFNDSAYAGVAKAVSDLSATCEEGEAEANEPESAREDRLRGMAEDGATAIIGVGFAYSDAVNAVAPDYPDVNFAVVDGYDPDDKANDNVAYLTFAANESSYLVGVAAALTTKTDEVGFVGGVHNDLIKGFEAGYTAGVKAVDPKITVDVQYIQESDLSGFADPAGGKTAAKGEFDKGADIVYHASGASGSGVFEAAVDAGDGKLAIGVDSDQYLTATPDEQPHILTSALKRVDVASFDFISSVADGKPDTSYVTYDLKNDGVGYATSNEALISGIQDQIDSYADKIKSGAIKVPTAP